MQNYFLTVSTMHSIQTNYYEIHAAEPFLLITFNVPGIAVSIISGNKVLMNKGYDFSPKKIKNRQMKKQINNPGSYITGYYPANFCRYG